MHDIQPPAGRKPLHEAKSPALVAHFIILTISGSGYLGIMLFDGDRVGLRAVALQNHHTFSASSSCPAVQLDLVATAGAIGCDVGRRFAYLAGAYGGRPFVERYGKYILLSGHDLDRTDPFLRWLRIDHRFSRAILLPVVRTFIALPAGIAKMPKLRFHLYTFLGSWPWCFGLAYVGMEPDWVRLRDTIRASKKPFHRFHTAVAVPCSWAWSGSSGLTGGSESAVPPPPESRLFPERLPQRPLSGRPFSFLFFEPRPARCQSPLPESRD